MKIKAFEFDLEIQKGGELFKKVNRKKLELKMFDVINKDNPTYAADFKDMEKLLTEDVDKGRIISYLMLIGCITILNNSPLFNIPGKVEEARDEVLKSDL